MGENIYAEKGNGKEKVSQNEYQSLPRFRSLEEAKSAQNIEKAWALR